MEAEDFVNKTFFLNIGKHYFFKSMLTEQFSNFLENLLAQCQNKRNETGDYKNEGEMKTGIFTGDTESIFTADLIR